MMISKWSELPMGKFLEIQKVEVGDDPVEATMRINAILAGKTVDEVMNMPLNEVAKMSEARKFLLKRPVARITRKKYRLGNTDYIFDGRPDKILTGQWIDLMHTDKDDIVGALSIFLIPEKAEGYLKGYDLEDVRMDILNHLSAEEGLSMANFFTTALDLLHRRAIRKAKKALKQARKQGQETQEAEKMLRLLEEVMTYTRGSASLMR